MVKSKVLSAPATIRGSPVLCWWQLAFWGARIALRIWWRGCLPSLEKSGHIQFIFHFREFKTSWGPSMVPRLRTLVLITSHVILLCIHTYHTVLRLLVCKVCREVPLPPMKWLSRRSQTHLCSLGSANGWHLVADLSCNLLSKLGRVWDWKGALLTMTIGMNRGCPQVMGTSGYLGGPDNLLRKGVTSLLSWEFTIWGCSQVNTLQTETCQRIFLRSNPSHTLLYGRVSLRNQKVACVPGRALGRLTVSLYVCVLN